MTRPYLPVDVVFHPNWWHKHYGLSFDRDFFYDPQRRVWQERCMRQLLYERFGALGLGQEDAPRRPIIGPILMGSGYIVQEILGCEVKYQEAGNPQVQPLNMSQAEVRALQIPEDIESTPSMRALLADGRWQIADSRWQIADGPSTIGHQPSAIGHQMISPKMYEELLLEHDTWLGRQLPPLGFHHCGNNAHLYTRLYARAGATYLDVGWGSDIAACRAALPDAWLSLRLNPVKMLTATPVVSIRLRLLDRRSLARLS